MTPQQIETKLKDLVGIERQTTNEILALINLAEQQDAALKLGFPSTLEWLTKRLGYSHAAAQRRIQSARLLRTVPEAADKLATGEVNLSTLAKTQSAIRAAEKISGQQISPAKQAEIIDAISNQTLDETERTLLTLLPETASSVHQERTKQLDEQHTRLMFNFDKNDMDNLAWAVDFFSHTVPDGAHGRVLANVLANFRKATEKKATAKAARASCSFVDERTGQVCGSTYQIEVDHIVPKALGGTDDPVNLRCLCRKHNQMMAREWLGENWANAWRRNG